MVSVPPAASMRSLPGSAVKLSSPGVPVSQGIDVDRHLIGVGERAAEPALPPSLVGIVSVSVPKKSCAAR